MDTSVDHGSGFLHLRIQRPPHNFFDPTLLKEETFARVPILVTAVWESAGLHLSGRPTGRP